MKQRLAGLFTVLIILSIAIVGCGTRAAVGCSAPAEEDTSEKTQLELGYAQWVSSYANAHMVKAVLEEKFDVTVNLNEMDARLMLNSIANGDIDFMLSFWLPCADAFLNELSEKVVNLGPFYDQAKIGLVVPTYVEIDSIDEINANADKFGGEIIGIELGGCDMFKAIVALDEYDMTDMQLVPGNEKSMLSALESAYENGEWIAVTGWTPHWKFDKMDLKFLEDPKNVYGKTQTINVLTRLNFAEDHPEVNKFLDTYSLNEEQFDSLINIMEEYDDDNEAAKVWIEENRALVDSWFE